jgi:hypothetical protein
MGWNRAVTATEQAYCKESTAELTTAAREDGQAAATTVGTEVVATCRMNRLRFGLVASS